MRCVRCLSWPPQAVDWPTRHRNYDWPDSATVDDVVHNGCDVVPVAHRQCKQHVVIGEYQWRLSFSRAEIVLINSWMPVQQVVYHMLRVFMKAERLTDSADNTGASKLSNYHLKTLMLWACEMKPKSWWTDDLNLVRICVQLLHSLAVRLTEARCLHYFINDCNLVDNSFDLEMIASRLVSISRPWLSSWFVNNYIRKCCQLCPRNVSRIFDDVVTTTELQNAVSAIVDWRLNTTLRHSWDVHEFAKCSIAFCICTKSLTVWSIHSWLYLVTISANFHVYIVSVAFLHVACKTQRTGMDNELMDVLAETIGLFTGPRRYSHQRGSSLSLSKAAKLMKAVMNKSRSTVQLIKIELSKAYLYRALRCKDSDSDTIYCLANVYLAVLYYATRQYQTAIDHCTLVMRSRDHSQCSSRVVQGELLPKVDDDIDVVLGLAVFYRHIKTAALNQQQQTPVAVFTTEPFAHYLHIKCLSVIKCQQLSNTFQSQSSTYQLQSHVKCVSDMQQLYITDILLRQLANGFSVQKCLFKQHFHRCKYSTQCPTELNTSDLFELLEQSAVEQLTTFRQLEARDFGSVVTIVTTDFEALYACKGGDYRRCLQLSTQNVHTLLFADDMSDVLKYPEFIQLLDDDIVSLTALTLIVNPKCRDIVEGVCITQLTLSLYLMTQCQLKLRHSVTSLTRTLDYIKVAQRRHPLYRTLDQLTLKLIARIVFRHLGKYHSE